MKKKIAVVKNFNNSKINLNNAVYKGLKYNIANGKATYIGAEDKFKSILIPSYIILNNYSIPVTNIASDTFSFELSNMKCFLLSSVFIKKNVTNIDERAFEKYTALRYIKLPQSLKYIGSYAFNDCYKLEKVILPNGVMNIGQYAFSNCVSIKKLVIPDSVISIGTEAFSNCRSLKKISIPDSIKSIGDFVFRNCNKLDYNVDYDNPSGKYLGNRRNSFVILMKVDNEIEQFEINLNTKFIGTNAFKNCYKLTNISIPKLVISIGSGAFSSCSKLTSIEIPNSVTSIGTYSFYECSSLTSVEIPKSVRNIEPCAFKGCSKLTDITIPDSVVNICSSAFEGCTNLKYNTYKNGKYLGNKDNPYFAFVGVISNDINTIEINLNTKIICSDALKRCDNIMSVTFEEGSRLINIGSSAFEGCRELKNITIPDSVRSIGSSAFKDCTKLTDIIIPDSVRSIGSAAFDGCYRLASIKLPNSITIIEDYTFSYCSGLENIVIPNSVTTIGIRAFNYCINLDSLKIPSSVNKIGVTAFYGCNNLKNFVVPDVPYVIEELSYEYSMIRRNNKVKFPIKEINQTRYLSYDYDNLDYEDLNFLYD